MSTTKNEEMLRIAGKLVKIDEIHLMLVNAYASGVKDCEQSVLVGRQTTLTEQQVKESELQEA